MSGKQISVFLVTVILFSLVSHVQASEESEVVAQFGTGFDEVVVVDSSDGLFDPRDLEFHPGRVNELWIANRGDDSMTIVHNTGLNNQTSETREDSNSNHFLEEVSAIAFGAYHPEFDWQWGSAQETQNTYCGLAATPNQFMGPTLWPSSLAHYAVENQNNGNGLLGSHIDMNHESPDGMGIAHDSGNAYWYFDGYYGELVYYDFQLDHDTGQDYHSDAIIHRYSEIELTRAGGIPGHMILDKQTGILYIADTGTNRILWVNTDDTSTNVQNILDPNWRNNPSSTQKEDLQEYSRITGVEWGVLDSGLSRPSGIALDGDTLFVSQNGNGKIVAYDLAKDGKSATEIETIQTSATFIMGLEIGPEGNLYYVDNGKDQVVRIDPYFDIDTDGVFDEDDNCPSVANPTQSNLDGDNFGDACDEDDDNDGILDVDDLCSKGNINWLSTIASDFDSDGCKDTTEDYDDDNDDVPDLGDNCQKGELGWLSSSVSDYDTDGCRDSTEDLDDDGDEICDGTIQDSVCVISTTTEDLCLQSRIGFISSLLNDIDRDGCEDASEDLDDDNDGFEDIVDYCPTEYGNSTLDALGCVDSDGDNFADIIDAFPQEPTQWSDSDGDGFGDVFQGFEGDFCINIAGTSFQDRNGCLDSDGDGWSDPDTYWRVLSGADAFPDDASQYADSDYDGFGDNIEGLQGDSCPSISGTSTIDVFGCLDSDGDGWSDSNDAFPEDATQYIDTDMDGYGDNIEGFQFDSCPQTFGNSTTPRFGCLDNDGDGWDNDADAFIDDSSEWLDSDGDGVGDNSDLYPLDASLFKEVEESETPSLTLLIVAIISLLLLALLIVRKRRKTDDFKKIQITDFLTDIQPNINASNTVKTTPQIPPEGIPQGWTMEQWEYYGEDYLRNR